MTNHVAALEERLAETPELKAGIFGPSIRLSWPAFLASIPRIAAVLPPEPSQRRRVTARDPVAFLSLVLATLYRGECVCLGAPGPETLDALVPDVAIGYQESDIGVILRRCLGGEGPRLIFATSGSTGGEKLVEKDWAALLAEAAWLSELFARHGAGVGTLALVPPWHLFGFLATFLVPLLRLESSHFALGSHGVWPVGDTQVPLLGTLVAVPALWPLVKSEGLSSAVPLVVTSGAALGRAREEELGRERRRGCRTRVIELFGSTETGGIGWRECLVDEPAAYRCFPQVSLDVEGGLTHARSPFTYPGNLRVTLADQLHVAADGTRFLHAGRTDRVFKWNGSRYALGDIERVLSEVSGVERVQCFYLLDPDRPKGGELVACLLGAKRDAKAVLKDYAMASSLPIPTRLYSVDTTHLSAMGKLAFAELRRIDPYLSRYEPAAE